jgi:hypothetical protein
MVVRVLTKSRVQAQNNITYSVHIMNLPNREVKKDKGSKVNICIC